MHYSERTPFATKSEGTIVHPQTSRDRVALRTSGFAPLRQTIDIVV